MLPDDFRVYLKNLEARIQTLERASQGALYRYGPLGIPSSLISPSALLNWDFEDGLQYWTVIGDASKVSIDRSKWYYGTQSLAIAPTSAAVGVQQSVNIGRSVSARVAFLAAQTAYEPNGRFSISFSFLNPSNQVISLFSQDFFMKPSGSLANWMLYQTDDIDVPSGASQMNVLITARGTTGKVNIDSVRLLLNGTVSYNDVNTVVVDQSGARNSQLLSGYIHVTLTNGATAGQTIVLPAVTFAHNLSVVPNVWLGIEYGGATPGNAAVLPYVGNLTQTSFTAYLKFFEAQGAGSSLTVGWIAFASNGFQDSSVNV